MLASNLPNAPGIYKIFFLDPSLFYIGSAINLRKRYREHLHGLRGGVHRNSHLQRAYAKYGCDALHFEAVEQVSCKENLIAREQYYIDLLQPYYNINPTAGSALGRKASPETRARLSASHKGLPPGNKGKPLSPETKTKLSASLEGRHSWNKDLPCSEKTKQRISETLKNKPFAKRKPLSPEHIAQMRATKLGKPSPKKGVPMTPEAHAQFLAKRRATTEAKGKQPSPNLGQVRSPEQRETIRTTLLNKTPEQKAQAREKQRTSVLNRTPEEQAQTKAKQRAVRLGKPNSRKGTHLSPEVRARALERRRANRAAKSPEVRAQSGRKQSATKAAKKAARQSAEQASLWNDETAS